MSRREVFHSSSHHTRHTHHTGHTRHAPLALGAVLLLSLLVLPGAASAVPCEVPDDGTGTVTLPPAGCDYLSPSEVHLIIDGLPPGTTIELAPIHHNFICSPRAADFCSVSLPPGLCETPGGGLGGNTDCFESEAQLTVTGTGLLGGYARTLTIPLNVEVQTGPRTPGDPVQDFDSEMFRLEGQLFGDPDFDFLSFRAGSAFGLPSPGHTTLTRLPTGNFNVDSFFDITYTIDFQGAPGSILDGLAGVTTGTIRMDAGEPLPPPGNPCAVPEGPPGTVTLPPQGCEYLSPDEVHKILDGLPPGTTIELAAIHKDFICGPQAPVTPNCSVNLSGACEGPGGSLGGSIDCFDSTAELTVSGTGDLAGYQRTLLVPLNVEVHTGPRNPGDPVQDFDTDMVRLEGQLFGDPDFAQLSIRAGSGLGLPPSPGHTTLTDVGTGTFTVDSFFDIVYTIDYQGAPGSVLDGFAGVTQGTIRMETGNPQAQQPNNLPALSGGWLLLFGLMLVGTGAILVLRRREAREDTT